MNKQVEIYLNQACQFHTSLFDEFDEAIQKMPTHTTRKKEYFRPFLKSREVMTKSRPTLHRIRSDLHRSSLQTNSEDEYSNIDLTSLTSSIWMLNEWVTGWRWQMNIIYSLVAPASSRITTCIVILFFEHHYIRYCYSWQLNLFLIFHCVISQ
jgi:hypothetical protein